MNPEAKKLGWKKDWPSLFYLLFALLGFSVSIYDIWVLQDLNLQLNVFLALGIIFFIIGGTFRIISRKTLMKAGFSMTSSAKLQIVENQQLVTDGIYGKIRHPLYVGEILRNFGFALLVTSLYGFLVFTLANLFLLNRIRIEEQMLIEEFGDEYKNYMKKTNRLIPHLY